MTQFSEPSRIPLYCKSANGQWLCVSLSRKKNFVNKIRRIKQEINYFFFVLWEIFTLSFSAYFLSFFFFFLRFAKDQFLLLSRSLSTGRRLIFWKATEIVTEHAPMCLRKLRNARRRSERGFISIRKEKKMVKIVICCFELYHLLHES